MDSCSKIDADTVFILLASLLRKLMNTIIRYPSEWHSTFFDVDFRNGEDRIGEFR